MLCSPPPATTLASSCAGSEGFCAPCCRRSSQRSRIHNRPKTGRTLLLHERLVDPRETILHRHPHGDCIAAQTLTLAGSRKSSTNIVSRNNSFSLTGPRQSSEMLVVHDRILVTNG